MIQAAPPDTLPTLKKRAEFLAVAKGGRALAGKPGKAGDALKDLGLM